MSAVLGDQMVQYQTMKTGTVGACVSPTQMYSTAGADGNLPAVALKPAPLRGAFSPVSTARREDETTDTKSESMGVGKQVLMFTLDGNTLVVPGNGITTGYAVKAPLCTVPAAFILVCLAHSMLDPGPVQGVEKQPGGIGLDVHRRFA